MDFLGHPKALSRLWACLMSDYEVVISNFLRSPGWTFSHFAEQAKKIEITLVYHCAVGKGKRRQEQYDEVVQVILEVAKDFWLSPDRPKYKPPETSASAKSMKCERNTETVLNGAAAVPMETSAEAATKSPAEAATKSPAEASTESPAEASTELPAEASTESPGEASTESPAEAAIESPAKADESDIWIEKPLVAPSVYFDKILAGDDDDDDVPTEIKKDERIKIKREVPTKIKAEKQTGTEFSEGLIGPQEGITGHNEEQTGLNEEQTGLNEEPTGLNEEPAGLNEELTGLNEEPTGLNEESTGLTEEPTALNEEEQEIVSTHFTMPPLEKKDESEIPSTSTSRVNTNSAELVMIKRQLGGFFLTYLLYFKQPYDKLHRVLIDSEDFEAIQKLEQKIQFLTPKIREQYDFMIFRMKLNHGFDIVAFEDRYGLGHATRIYLNNKKNEIVELIKEDKNVQDKLSQCQDVQAGQKKYQRYFEQKRLVLNESILSVLRETCPSEMPSNLPDDSKAVCELVPNLRSTEAIGQMVEAASKIKVLGQQPMFTHANLLGNESADRIFIKEACKRIKRMQVKQEKGKILNKKTLNPYVREGGIFGRKKDFEEGEEHSRRKKERAQTSGNLWNYINGIEFNYGRPPAPPPPTGSVETAGVGEESAEAT